MRLNKSLTITSHLLHTQQHPHSTEYIKKKFQPWEMSIIHQHTHTHTENNLSNQVCDPEVCREQPDYALEQPKTPTPLPPSQPNLNTTASQAPHPPTPPVHKDPKPLKTPSKNLSV